MSDAPEMTLERVFKAPRAMVWRTWTEPEFLARWYGPGVETIIHKFEPVPGGLWLNEMRWGENAMFSKAEFLEVEPEARLVFLISNTDADWNVIDNPMMPDWPRVLRTIVTFAEEGGQTEMRFVWTPEDASPAETACFAGALEQMSGGWASGFAMIEEILAEMQAG